MLTVNFLAIFQHTNIRTPRWLGYFIQRPESHSIHHGRGIHRYNYADLPVLDMLFGTFRNAPSYAPATGFYDGASGRVADMLLLRDVSSAERPREVARGVGGAILSARSRDGGRSSQREIDTRVRREPQRL